MSELNLSDRREAPHDGALPPFGNGKKRIAMVVLAGVVSVGGTIVTARWTAKDVAAGEATKAQISLDRAVAIIEERQRNQNTAVLRELQLLREDVREIGRRR